MKNFEWPRLPSQEAWLNQKLDHFKLQSSWIAKFDKELYEKTSTRLFDWIDHIFLPNSLEEEAKQLGFIKENQDNGWNIYLHPEAKFPALVFQKDCQGIAFRVDSIADFLMVRGLNKEIEGKILAPFRRCLISNEKGICFYVVERKGTREMIPSSLASNYQSLYLEAQELWQKRPRIGYDEENEIEAATAIAKKMAEMVGKNVAAYICLECERSYWQRKNRAGTLQKYRQDHFGLGWSNQDHHTFRSSRKLFSKLVNLFEIFGFESRERYYAGEEAGWGAQIMENPISGHVLFLDVDLSAEEVGIDFAHTKLPERDKLGTVGLWCALHGDSILKGGMHHLEAQFEFERLKQDLASFGINMMNPFSNFPFLRQAFTTAEMWQVMPERIEKLLEKKLITLKEAERLKNEGAVGSHLENLQRHEGYKGFNKKGVNQIIKETNPLHS